MDNDQVKTLLSERRAELQAALDKAKQGVMSSDALELGVAVATVIGRLTFFIDDDWSPLNREGK